MNLPRSIGGTASLVGMLALGSVAAWISYVPVIEQGPGVLLLTAPLGALVHLEKEWRAKRAARGMGATNPVATSGRVLALFGVVALAQAVFFAFGDFLTSRVGCSDDTYCSLGNTLFGFVCLIIAFGCLTSGSLVILLSRLVGGGTPVSPARDDANVTTGAG